MIGHQASNRLISDLSTWRRGHWITPTHCPACCRMGWVGNQTPHRPRALIGHSRNQEVVSGQIRFAVPCERRGGQELEGYCSREERLARVWVAVNLSYCVMRAWFRWGGISPSSRPRSRVGVLHVMAAGLALCQARMSFAGKHLPSQTSVLIGIWLPSQTLSSN
jgi:hypothetical protein